MKCNKILLRVMSVNITLSENDEIVMRLIHYFITEQGYNPVLLHGAKDEIWLEKHDADYKIIRIVSNYIHNNEQLDMDLYRTKQIIKKIKRKMFSFKMNTLSIFINLGDNVEIDVFGRLDGYDKGLFDGISNLKYRGKYDGFNSLDTNSYNLYLYTSNIDGIPNCLLEAAAAGLPIIAPNVGGIGEFIINKKTGVLIDKYDDIDAFVKAIDFAEKHPETMQKYAKNAQNLLRKQHSWDTFIENVKHDFGKE